MVVFAVDCGVFFKDIVLFQEALAICGLNVAIFLSFSSHS